MLKLIWKDRGPRHADTGPEITCYNAFARAGLLPAGEATRLQPDSGPQTRTRPCRTAGPHPAPR